MNTSDGLNNYGGGNEVERLLAEEEAEQDKTVREKWRQLAIEALKRKKLAEGKEMLKRKVRIAELQRRQARAAIQKAISRTGGEAAKKFATQVARQMVMFVLRIIAAVIASFGFYILIALLIIIIIVVIVAAINYLCNSTWIGEAICGLFL